MNPSNPAKFGMAFALGLVVALAAVTVYVKTAGLHVQQPAAVVSATQPTKQPEILNAPKVEEPTLASAPETKSVKQTAVPRKVVQPRPPFRIQAEAKSAPAHLVRARNPKQSYQESTSTIRVEVSQAHQPSQPASSETPVSVPAGQAIRVVDEDQAQPVPAYPVAAPVTPVAAPAQPHVVTLPSGTSISIRMGETLSTDHNFSGDTFRASLDRPIVQDGFIIAEKGSKVLGKIASLRLQSHRLLRWRQYL